MAQPRQVMSARRALDVLCAFSAERPEWSVTEMSQHLGVHKSTMSRLLTTLRAHVPHNPPAQRTVRAATDDRGA